MEELLEDVEPLMQDQQVIDDMHSMVVALESMEIFKNLGLLDMKCNEPRTNFVRLFSAIFPITWLVLTLQTLSRRCSTTGTWWGRS